MTIEAWIEEKFIAPLCKYYTLENTITYALILIIIAVGIYKFLHKMDIKIDKRFFIALLPFIIYGGWTRALRDHGLGIYTKDAWWFCSPPIYFIIFSIAFISLIFAIFAQKRFRVPYEKTMMLIGAGLLLYNLSITQIQNTYGFLIIAALALFWAALFFIVSKQFPTLLSRMNAAILSTHLLDASASFTAIQFFGYYEQHVLPSALISLFGPAVMLPLKITVVWAVLWAIDKYSEKGEENFKNFLKLIILILGLALGVRDWLTVGMMSI